MALRIDCPNCGSRPFTEFSFGGEVRAIYDPAQPADADYQRLWLPENAAGRQTERWFHVAGCRRWLTVDRDTTTNEVYAVR